MRFRKYSKLFLFLSMILCFNLLATSFPRADVNLSLISAGQGFTLEKDVTGYTSSSDAAAGINPASIYKKGTY